MDETTRELIAKITVRFDKPTRIVSDHAVTVFYDCSKLIASDLARLSAIAIGSFDKNLTLNSTTIGLVGNGLYFAFAVSSGGRIGFISDDFSKVNIQVGKNESIILVDDVICSGTRFSKAKKLIESYGAIVKAFVAIVDRRESPGALDGVPVFTAYQTVLE